MSMDNNHILPDPSGLHHYPTSHWKEISRFLIGNERDPKDLFYLADDVWEAWPYAPAGLPSQPGEFRYRFKHLCSFLKPYVKWYCYQHLLACHDGLSRSMILLPTLIRSADIYLYEHHIGSPDDITGEYEFRKLWSTLLLPQPHNDASSTRAKVRIQVRTHAFWKQLQKSFGFPHIVPSTDPYEQARLTESAFDESQVIPLAVINQFANKLALHKDGREQLSRFHHLRLCILMLIFASGRRVSEILTAPRGVGQDGPLAYYPTKGGSSEGSLWFRFSPNKYGPQDHVHISREWEDVVKYCVKELLCYSDEIRDMAASEAQDFFILISPWNLTAGPEAALALPLKEVNFKSSEKFLDTFSKGQSTRDAIPVSYKTFHSWLHGHSSNRPAGRLHGIVETWKITVDGSADGEIYHLRTHQARHTRQSAIASDPHVSPLVRQRDLNHIDRNMQVHYQHNARKQNEILLEKAKNGELVGPAMKWFSTLFGTHDQNGGQPSQFQAGQPQLLSPRWRNLIQNNPQFMQFNHVPCGYCALPQGPDACEDYLNCTEAEDGGCKWFLTDPRNAGMLIQITEIVRKHKQQEQESLEAGREVQAEKYHALASRSSSLEAEVFSRCDIEAFPNCSQDLKDRLKARYLEIKEEAQIDEHAIPIRQSTSSEMDTHEHRDKETLPKHSQSIKDHLKERMQEMEHGDL